MRDPLKDDACFLRPRFIRPGCDVGPEPRLTRWQRSLRADQRQRIRRFGDLVTIAALILGPLLIAWMLGGHAALRALGLH